MNYRQIQKPVRKIFAGAKKSNKFPDVAPWQQTDNSKPLIFFFQTQRPPRIEESSENPQSSQWNIKYFIYIWILPSCQAPTFLESCLTIFFFFLVLNHRSVVKTVTSTMSCLSKSVKKESHANFHTCLFVPALHARLTELAWPHGPTAP